MKRIKKTKRTHEKRKTSYVTKKTWKNNGISKRNKKTHMYRENNKNKKNKQQEAMNIKTSYVTQKIDGLKTGDIKEE